MKEISIIEINESRKNEVIILYRNFAGIGLDEARQAIGTLPLTVKSENEPALYEFHNRLVELDCNVTSDEGYSGDDNALVTLGSVSLLPEKLRPPVKLAELSQDETMLLLSEIGQTCDILNKLYSHLNYWSDRLKQVKSQGEAMRKKTHPLVHVITLVCGIAGLVGGFWGVIGGLIGGRILGKIICKAPKLRAKINDEADNYIKTKSAPIQEKIDLANENLGRLNATDRVEWAVGIVGEAWFNPEDISGLTDLIKSGRADSLKEALNLYDDVQHRKRMESMQMDVKLATEISASEAMKQTREMQAQSQQMQRQAQQLQEINQNTKEAIAAAKKAGTQKMYVHQKVDVRFKK